MNPAPSGCRFLSRLRLRKESLIRIINNNADLNSAEELSAGQTRVVSSFAPKDSIVIGDLLWETTSAQELCSRRSFTEEKPPMRIENAPKHILSVFRAWTSNFRQVFHLS